MLNRELHPHHWLVQARTLLLGSLPPQRLIQLSPLLLKLLSHQRQLQGQTLLLGSLSHHQAQSLLPHPMSLTLPNFLKQTVVILCPLALLLLHSFTPFLSSTARAI